MIIPQRPISGQKKPKGWDAQLWDWIKSMTIFGDGKTIFVKKMGDGITLSAKPFTSQESVNNPGGGSAVSSVPAKIVSGTSPYTVDVYANGYDQAATSTRATAEVLMLNYAATLTAGTKVLALLAKTNVTGGEDVV